MKIDRRLLWVGSGLVLTGLAVWLLEAAPAAPSGAPVGAAAMRAASPAWVAAAAPSAASAVPAIESTARQPAQVSTAPPAVLAGPTQQPASAEERVVDLCGVGRIPLPVGAEYAASEAIAAPPSPLLGAAVEAAWPRLLAALQAGSPADRAAALLLGAEPPVGADGVANRAAALFAQAVQSREGAVLATAFGRCGAQVNDPTCIALARAWATVEPDNAAAWLSLYGVDPASKTQVLGGLAGTRHSTLHTGWLAGRAQARMPGDLPPYLQMLLLVDVVGIEAASTVPSLLSAQALCHEPSEAARAICTHTMQVVQAHSDTLMGMGIGVRLATQLNRPAAEVQVARDRLRALQQLSMAGFRVDEPQPLSCEAVGRMQVGIEANYRLGEVGRLREAQKKAAGPPK